ncbi:DUF4180 domain-containing protein [Paenibacillus urinalis]|uniref:DUF4180 domain-containing protein n=1 Tax=Paenibacillus urinalis TaxID=521520 RepID=UPI00236863BA|nr:DUF4180 domain-containing protein [Paenibacillus urinalis]WDH95434.1 DUF4180 domain-containing protein [Paenibacillus urinalis]
MEISAVQHNGVEIAVVRDMDVLIEDVQSALDLMATVKYETGSSRIVLHKSAIAEPFFDLKTKLAGEIMQKFVNYQTNIAIVGDYSIYESKSLKDFIYESNKGRHIFFLDHEEQAVEKLSRV